MTGAGPHCPSHPSVCVCAHLEDLLLWQKALFAPLCQWLESRPAMKMPYELHMQRRERSTDCRPCVHMGGGSTVTYLTKGSLTVKHGTIYFILKNSVCVIMLYTRYGTETVTNYVFVFNILG